MGLGFFVFIRAFNGKVLLIVLGLGITFVFFSFGFRIYGFKRFKVKSLGFCIRFRLIFSYFKI